MNAVQQSQDTIRIGADRLLYESNELIEGKRIGLLTNHTGRLSNGSPLIDMLAASDICRLHALYGPEHGIAGDTPDGEVVEHGRDPKYGVQVYSLYGKTHKPTAEMLDGVEVIVCDIQDVGARFYTFISTIALALEAAGEMKIPFVLLDRPNPIRGLSFDGPVRVESLKAFVAWMPIPISHGLTIGELATLWNNEGWLANSVKAPLTVVEMDGWERSMWYDETGLAWIPPSPNMPTLETAVVYPGMCLIEGTSISEGRGTASPFQLIGAPWADPERILKELSSFQIPGVAFAPAEFTPTEIPGTASEPKYEGTLCRGIRLSVTDRSAVSPVHLGICVLSAFKRAYPAETVLRNRRFDILSGNKSVRQQLDRGSHPDEICAAWEPELRAFGEVRSNYLLY